MERIEISKEEMQQIIKSGNLYFAHPVNLGKGIYPVKSMRTLKKITMESSESEDYGDVLEIFTYWENRETPLFDIVAMADKNYVNIDNVKLKYELSDCSLFGMYWFKDNKPSVGMLNMSQMLDIPMPTNTDLEKYTRNNYEVAKASFDFI